MALRFVDMRSATATANTGLIPFATGRYRAGDPEIGEPQREVRIDRKFFTFSGEVTNADVRQIATHMTSVRKFGIYGLDQEHGPLLVATSPDTAESHFEMVDPKLYGAEIGITDWQEQRDRFARLVLTRPIQIIPDDDRYETFLKKYNRTDAEHFAQDEMAATVITWWEAKALATFFAGAMGLSGTSDLMSSDQFDAIVQGLKYMTSTGKLTDDFGSPLRAYALSQIVPVNDPRFPSLANGIRPNTTWNWTRTGWHNRDGGPFLLDLQQFIAVLRGGSWDSDGDGVRLACRLNLGPGFRPDDVGFRLVLAREDS